MRHHSTETTLSVSNPLNLTRGTGHRMTPAVVLASSVRSQHD
jgi:hypothetical protein